MNNSISRTISVVAEATTSPDWMQFVVDGLNVFAALIVAFTAFASLNKWKAETRAKRRMELAEEALAFAYEGKDTIDIMRAPWSPASEQEEIKRHENETDKDFNYRRTYSVAGLRYEKNKDVFAKLLSIRYRVAAALGLEYRTALEALVKRAHEVLSAAVNAHRYATLEARNINSPEEHQKYRENREKWEAIMGWYVTEEDPFDTSLSSTMSRIEELFAPVAAEGEPRVLSWRVRLAKKLKN